MAGLFSALVHGCTLHLSSKFSASRFFFDVAEAKGTHVIYVGEMLRFVMAKTPSAEQSRSTVERFIGNGLDLKTWEKLAVCFPRARIVEFYGATELPALLVNLAAQPGAMGRAPFRAWSRFCVAKMPEGVVAVPDGVANAPDGVANAPDGLVNAPDGLVNAPEGVAVRVSRPFATKCAPGEMGELLIAMPRRKWPLVGAFEGYFEKKHESRALVSDVFVPGDRYYRTGDVVYYDENDFFYFVDRLGDVWRHRGHNVSTRWVTSQLRQCPSVLDVLVTPVAVDDSPYRAGLAVVVPYSPFNVTAMNETIKKLPGYARPQYVLLVSEFTMTRSFKVPKKRYRRDVFMPDKAEGTLYEWDDELKRIDG
jgi:fatty-acyl-CoA synthase